MTLPPLHCLPVSSVSSTALLHRFPRDCLYWLVSPLFLHLTTSEAFALENSMLKGAHSPILQYDAFNALSN